MGGNPTDSPVLGEILEGSEGGRVEAPARPAGAGARGRQAWAEALAWALFSAGGFVSAVVLPVNVAVLGVAYGAGWLPARTLSYSRVAHLAHNPIVRLYLLAVIVLPLYHWAHRFRFAVHHQFGIHAKRLVALGCYGTAVAATGLTVWVLLRL